MSKMGEYALDRQERAQQTLLDLTPPLARRSDPDTSHAAAKDAGLKASHGRQLVLRHLADSPLTDFELAARTGWQQTSIGKRRGECMAAGLVGATVLKRLTPSGSLARVWEITAAGREYLAGLNV